MLLRFTFLRLLQYRLDYKLSVERIVKALNSSNCLIEDRDEIRILKNSDYQEYKKDSTFLSNEVESLNDFLFILEKLNVEIPRSRYKFNKFKEYLQTIKY